MKPIYLSANAYAKHRGCTLRAVQLAIEGGRIDAIKKGKRWQINPVAADLQWEANTRHSGQDEDLDEGADEDPTHYDKSGNPLTQSAKLQAARVIKEQQLAKLKELEYEEKSGNLIERKVVEAQLAKFASSARDALLNIPSRIAAELAADVDPHSIELKLSEEIRQTMNDFCEQKISI